MLSDNFPQYITRVLRRHLEGYSFLLTQTMITGQAGLAIADPKPGSPGADMGPAMIVPLAITHPRFGNRVLFGSIPVPVALLLRANTTNQWGRVEEVLKAFCDFVTKQPDEPPVSDEKADPETCQHEAEYTDPEGRCMACGMSAADRESQKARRLADAAMDAARGDNPDLRVVVP